MGNDQSSSFFTRGSMSSPCTLQYLRSTSTAAPHVAPSLQINSTRTSKYKQTVSSPFHQRKLELFSKSTSFTRSQDAVRNIRLDPILTLICDQLTPLPSSLPGTPLRIPIPRLNTLPIRSPLHHNLRIPYPPHRPRTLHILLRRRPLPPEPTPPTQCRPLHNPAPVPLHRPRALRRRHIRARRRSRTAKDAICLHPLDTCPRTGH